MAAPQLEMVECRLYGEKIELPKVIVDLIQSQRDRLREYDAQRDREMIERFERDTGQSWAEIQAEAASRPSPWVLVDP